MSQIGVYVPTNVKEALYRLAHHRSEPRDETTMSSQARDYIVDGIEEDVRNSENLPPEIYDLLDTDQEANGGGDEF